MPSMSQELIKSIMQQASIKKEEFKIQIRRIRAKYRTMFTKRGKNVNQDILALEKTVDSLANLNNNQLDDILNEQARKNSKKV